MVETPGTKRHRQEWVSARGSAGRPWHGRTLDRRGIGSLEKRGRRSREATFPRNGATAMGAVQPPLDSGREDYIGAFVVTTGLGVDRLCQKYDAELNDFIRRSGLDFSVFERYFSFAWVH